MHCLVDPSVEHAVQLGDSGSFEVALVAFVAVQEFAEC